MFQLYKLIKLPAANILAILLILVVNLFAGIFQLSALQVSTGLLIAGFLPGALLVELIFSYRTILTAFEKIVLSIAVSILLTMGISLLLNLLKQGLIPTRIYTAMYGIILLLLIAYGFRYQRSLFHGLGQVVPGNIIQAVKIGNIFTQRNNRILSALLLLSVLLLVILSARSKNGEVFSEFYVLDTSGKALSENLAFSPGKSYSFIVGISNQTNSIQSYYVIASYSSNNIVLLSERTISSESTVETPVSITIPDQGTNTLLLLSLWNVGGSKPIHTLNLQVGSK